MDDEQGIELLISGTEQHVMTTNTINENPTDSNLVAHAIRELDLIGETSYEEPSMRKCILDIVRLVSDQGHSGSSVNYLIAQLHALLQFQPLSPITDAPEYWVPVSEGLWQCARDPECFSEDGGKTYKRLGNVNALHTSVVSS